MPVYPMLSALSDTSAILDEIDTAAWAQLDSATSALEMDVESSAMTFGDLTGAIDNVVELAVGLLVRVEVLYH